MNVKKSNPFEKFAQVSDDEWLSLLIRSITERAIDGISFPGFPCPDVQKMTVGSEHESALREAFQFFVYSKQVLTRNSISFSASTRMIDFGVCWGRIARLFLRDVTPQNIVGLEVDEAFIEMSKSLGLPVEIYKVDPLGPSSLTSNTFDFVTAYSVFSHLDEIAADKWVEEFYRVLKLA